MYYFISQNLDDMTTMSFLGHSEESGKRLWVSGQKFLDPYPRDEFYVKPRMGSGREMPDFFDSSVPLMTKRLVQALLNHGIDNFDAYPVIIKEIGTDNIWENYLAINFFGLIDAVDQDKSEIDSEDDDIFYSTVIDNSKAKNFLCFRLFKGPELLVIHENVAKALIKENFTGLLVIKTEDYDYDNFF